jgi:hypothetical protein
VNSPATPEERRLMDVKLNARLHELWTELKGERRNASH